MGVSQPTLSRSIQEIERQLGVQLFDRSRRHVEPTSFGSLVLGSARRVALDIAELKREIALLKGLNVGELTIGVGPVVAQTWIGDAVGRLIAKHPELKLHILNIDWFDIPAALHERRTDFAIGEMQEATEDPDIAVEPLPHRSACFYCRTGHPLQRIKKPTLRDIGEYPLVAPKLPKRVNDFLARGRAMGHLAEGGQYFEPRIQCQNLEAILQVVESSNAVGIATTATISSLVEIRNVLIIPFHAAWLRTNYAIMRLRERSLAPAASALYAEIREAERRYNEITLPNPTKWRRRRHPH